MSDQQSPLVSVLCLNYNQKDFVCHALETIRNQTYGNIELLINDDASSDGSPEVITSWLEQNNVQAKTFFMTENSGVCKSLNRLLEHATGEWIAVLAADDYWEPHHLQTLVERAVSLSDDYGVVYSDSVQVDEQCESLGRTFISDHRNPEEIENGDIFFELANRNWISAISTLTRTRIFHELGYYDERLVYEDYDMWLRIALKYKFWFINECTSSTRIVSTSITRVHLHTRSVAAEMSDYYIAVKLLESGRLTKAQRAKQYDKITRTAKKLYRLKAKGRVPVMWKALRGGFDVKLFLKTLDSMVRG